MSSKTAQFWDKQAVRYAAQPVKDKESYEQMLQTVATHLKPNDNVLEIGCGTGSTAVRMAQQVANWTATDISSGMIDIANSKDAPDSAKFVVADADTKFENAPFDVACAFHILHLVPDPQSTIKSLFAQIKPGGLFISKTVCPGEMGVVPRIVVPIMQFFGVAPTSLHLLRVPELRAMVKAAGFNIIEDRTFGTSKSNPYFVAQRPV